MARLNKLTRYLRIFYRWRIRSSIALDYMPEEISIEATNVCNFKCTFCPQSDPQHHQVSPRTYLDTKSASLILANLREGGVKTETLHWTLDGEPFMNRRFPELCSVAVQYNFRNMYFATNGMLLSEDVLAKLPTGSRVHYTFTIDFASDRNYFEEVRGTLNSWERIQSNIQTIAADQKWKHISIEVSDISTYKFSKPEETETRFSDLKALFKNPYGRLRFFRKTFHNAAGLVSAPSSRGNKYHLCPYPWVSLMIASNGDVVACCRDLRRQTVLGNLLRQSLSEVWNGDAFITLRQNLIDGHPERSAACNGCDLPYDDSKFSAQNMFRAIRGRFQLFDV